MSLVKKWRRLSWRERRLIGEAGFFLVFAKLALGLLPFRWIAPLLKTQKGRWPTADEQSPRGLLAQIAVALARCGRRLPWESSCLEQAWAAKIMCMARGIRGKVILGVATEGERFGAHAWLRCGEMTLTGGPMDPRFTLIEDF